MSMKRAALALVLSSILSTAAFADGQRVILVLDASGSMWGQINGKAKMDIAKDVVGKVLSTWKPEDDIGLVVYGHREKGSCTDIETVLHPRPLTIDDFMSPVKALSPKGKTPMTQAVRQAAEALKYTEQQSTVILVSDGLETCGADPCAVARELEKSGVNLTVHTVGFGLDDKNAIAQLKCMAEETGGISIIADNADELESALKQTVEAKAEEPPPPEPAPAPEPVDAKDFTGHVYMADGVELPPPFDQAIWVFSTNLDGTAGEYLSTDYGKVTKTDIPKGGDLVTIVTADMAKIVVPFKHEDGAATSLEVNLNAGVMQFQGMLDESTELPAEGPTWVFRTAKGDYYGTSYGAAPKNLFNAGDYVLTLSHGSASIEANFTVVAGKVTEMVVPLGAGIANVSVTYDGSQVVSDGTTIELRKAADISGEKKYVATEYGHEKQFKAIAGDYVVVARLNLAEVEVPVKILAGQGTDVKINLNAGFIAVKSAGAQRIDIESSKPGIDGKRDRLGTEYAAELNYAATAGNYHIVVYGAGDAIIGEKDVTVETGKRTEVAVP
jgi:Ca-activated chloride channel homolog